MNEELLKLITKKDYIIVLAKLADRKIMFYFAGEKSFDEKGLSNKSTRDKSLISFLQSPAVMVSGFSTKFLPKNHNQ